MNMKYRKEKLLKSESSQTVKYKYKRLVSSTKR